MASDAPYFHGAAYVILGDPTQATGAGMTDLEETVSCTVRLVERKSIANSPMGQPQSDSVYTLGTRFEIDIEHSSATGAILAAMFDTLTASGEELTVEDDWAQISPQSMCVVPIAEKAGAASNDEVWWFPAVTTQGNADFTFNTTEGEDAQNNYTTTFTSLYRETDQDSSAIPAGKRIGFRGAAINSWSLPSAYDS